MLTSIRDSELAKLFKEKESHFILDRNPVIFNYVLEFLRSDGIYIPKNEDEKEKSLFVDELKHWGIECHQNCQNEIDHHDNRSLKD